MNNITSNKFINMFSGRKRESEVWKHSTYDQQNRKREQNKNMRTSKPAHLAQDLICAPASQAYVECVFSLCGPAAAGRRSNMRKSLEMCVFLKLNQEILQQTGFPL